MASFREIELEGRSITFCILCYGLLMSQYTYRKASLTQIFLEVAQPSLYTSFAPRQVLSTSKRNQQFTSGYCFGHSVQTLPRGLLSASRVALQYRSVGQEHTDSFYFECLQVILEIHELERYTLARDDNFALYCFVKEIKLLPPPSGRTRTSSEQRCRSVKPNHDPPR